MRTAAQSDGGLCVAPGGVRKPHLNLPQQTGEGAREPSQLAKATVTQRSPMMRRIDLREYAKSAPLKLSVDERDALTEALPSLTIEPAQGTEGWYNLTPGSTVGAIEIGELSVLIRPKIPIPQLLSLACYAMGAYKSQDERAFEFEEERSLPDTLALALISAARRAFARGLLHGYRTEEEALHIVRGRIMFAEQIRRRFGMAVPVEVRYDEFTDAILANQLVKSAVHRLGGMRLRSGRARRGIGGMAGTLDNVSLVEFPPRNVPAVEFDRLNEHYRGVVALSRLILRHSAFESGRGRVRAAGFLMDMNVVFQEFATQALREALGASAISFCSDKQLTGNRRIHLAKHDRVRLEPDLSWWHGSECVFVGDAKYKRIRYEGVPNADLYQLLAYVTALDLPGSLLVYAQGEATQRDYVVRHSGKRLEVAALDLSGNLEDVLERVKGLADRVWALRAEAHRMARAA